MHQVGQFFSPLPQRAHQDHGIAEPALQGGPFGAAIDTSRVDYWTGLRPATPSNVPLIGRTRYPNLYLNTGHGTLGWTMAAGSGKALAELMSGAKPEIGFDFLGG